jgi:superfamily II DNA or RNA helicase
LNTGFPLHFPTLVFLRCRTCAERTHARMAPGGYLPHARVGIFPHPQGHDYRCYQSAIVRTALCYNTLVALPTGTGKTLVAAAVLHNFLQ